MKTKLSAALVILIFMMSCGAPQKKEDLGTTPAPEAATAPVKFILKAPNMKYVTVADSMLVANEAVPEKAMIFEQVALGEGKYALKTSAGKFVTDNRNGISNLIAIIDWAGDWETFEIIAVDDTHINIKATSNKFVYAAEDGFMYAKSENAGPESVFVMEQK